MAKQKLQEEVQKGKQEAPIQDKPAKEVLEKEQVKTEEYSLEIVRDYYGNVDPFYLSKKDPEYAYRFLRDDHKNLNLKTGNMLFQKGGWQITPKAHLLKLGIKESDIAPDGLLRRGDQILAFMPKKIFEEKQKHKAEQAKNPSKMINRLLKEGDPNTGGKGLHESMKGIQTQEALKGNWK